MHFHVGGCLYPAHLTYKPCQLRQTVTVNNNAFDDYCGPEYLQKSAKYITVVLIDTITSIRHRGGGGVEITDSMRESEEAQGILGGAFKHSCIKHVSCDVCIFNLSWDKTSWLAQFCFKALPKLTFISDG